MEHLNQEIYNANNKISIEATHTAGTIIDALEYDLHRQNIWTEDSRFNQLHSLFNIIRRIPLMQQLIDRAISKKSRQLLLLSEELEEIILNIGQILNYQTEFRIDGELVDDSADDDPDYLDHLDDLPEQIEDIKAECVSENREFFCSTILCALLLCCDDPRQEPQIQIDLNHDPEHDAIEIIISAMTENKNSDPVLAGLLADFLDIPGEFPAEKKMLNTFCALHNGTWDLHQDTEGEFAVRRCKIVFQSAKFDTPEFHRSEPDVSPEQLTENCQIILSEFCSKR